MKDRRELCATVVDEETDRNIPILAPPVQLTGLLCHPRTRRFPGAAGEVENLLLWRSCLLIPIRVPKYHIVRVLLLLHPPRMAVQ